MRREDEAYIHRNCPNLYSTKTPISVGQGWLEIIEELSTKLEKLIVELIEKNNLSDCETCRHDKRHHYGSATPRPGECLLVSPLMEVDPDRKEGDSIVRETEYLHRCWCKNFVLAAPHAVQIKEKFGTLRFYLNCGTREMTDLISEAEGKTHKTCEDCGKPGERAGDGWVRTLCVDCDKAFLGE